jgi:hypothetical protein
MSSARPLPPPFDPVLEALRRAQVGEPFTPEQRAELDQAVEDIAAGRVQLVAHDDVPAWLEARAREQAG